MKLQDPEFLANNPYLFATRLEIGDTLARIELFKKIFDIPGYIVECGSNTGNHLMLFALLSTVYEPYAINRKLICFDTFDGFRSINTEADGDLSKHDFSNSDFDLLKKCTSIYDMNRNLSHINKINLVRGDAVEKIPEWKKQNKEAVISLLYIDLDVEEPTFETLNALWDRVVKGGIVVFDEYAFHKWSESEAVDRFFSGKNAEIKSLDYICPTAFIEKTDF